VQISYSKFQSDHYYGTVSFMEVTVTQYSFVDIFCTQLYPDHLKNVENIKRISFHPLSDFWLAMY